MSFVGTRPEATKYVEKYSNEMLATLLLVGTIIGNIEGTYNLLEYAIIYIVRVLNLHKSMELTKQL